jgi:predicted permease
MTRVVVLPFLSVLSDPILPVFAILALGFVMGRAGWMSEEQARTVNRFAMAVLIPIVLFDLLANAPFEAFSILPLLIYALAQIFVFAIGFLIAHRVFRVAPGEAVILGYAGIFANNVFYALPIAVLLYGEASVLPIMTIVILDSTLSMGGTMIALQAIEKGDLSARILVRIFNRTPALIAMFAGLTWGLLSLPVPQPVQTFLDFNGQAAAPVALFALGVVLSNARLRPDGTVLTTVAIKLLIFPAAIALALVVLAPGDWIDHQKFVFGAAGPAGATAFSIAILYGIPTDRIAQVLIWTSVLTLVTLAVLA